MKKTILTILTGSLLSLQIAAPAFAINGDFSNMAVIRHDSQNTAPVLSDLIRIEGALSCNLGATNGGQGCDLKLTENKTGRIFNLIEARTAMRLYQDGNKNVIIEGRLAGAETIEVKEARTL